MLYRVMNAVERANGLVFNALPSTRNQHRKSDDQASYHDKIERQMRHLVAVTQARKTDCPKAANSSSKAPLKRNGLSTNHRHHNMMKTLATPSSAPSLSTSEPILTPDLIQRHCSTILKSTSAQLTKEQDRVEGRLNKSLHRLRRRQFSLSHTHTKRQIEIRSTREDDIRPPEIPHSSLLGDLESSSDSTISLAPSSPPPLPKDLPEGPALRPKEPLKDHKASYSLQQQLQALQSLVDDDATCSSSDEEEDVRIETGKKDRWSRYGMRVC